MLNFLGLSDHARSFDPLGPHKRYRDGISPLSEEKVNLSDVSIAQYRNRSHVYWRGYIKD